MTMQDSVTLAAVGDLHHVLGGNGALRAWLGRASEDADVLAICGDLTDYGRVEEAEELARELATVRVPIVAVLGNHDYESGREGEVRAALEAVGVSVLDGETFEVGSVGFAGIKGFAGGFGRGALGPWGEPLVKQFVQEAIDEALKLETALARLRTPHRVALLHYAPIAETVEGEPREIFPYLGCSRLAEPLARYPVTAVFHGHAHNGRPEGRTGTVPVYNVSLPLLKKTSGDRPYKLIRFPTLAE